MTKSDTASARQISRWRTLSRRKGREREGLFLIEGERAVRQVMENGALELEAILLDQGTRLEGRSAAPVFELDQETFRSISTAQSPQGVVAVAVLPGETTLATLGGRDGILLATDAIQDPGNLGTLLRTALWFGAKGVLVGKGTVDLWNPKVVRSTAGATGVLPWCTGELDSMLETLEGDGWRSTLLDVGESSLALGELEEVDRRILVVGNEGNGIDPSLKQAHRTLVRIDGLDDRIESLNAAIAAGIALYSLSR